jgi:putative intracellular protease/amidase
MLGTMNTCLRRFTATALALALFTTLLSANDAPPIRVALLDDAGATGQGIPRVTEQLGKTSDIKATIVKGGDIAAGALKDYDVVMFTGGSGSKQAGALGEAGREEVRKFVERGGGYVGICAGAYLACSGFSWGIGVLDAKTVSPKWRRGSGTVQIEVTADGKAVTGLATKRHDIRYVNGPIIQPHGREDIPDYEPLALFRTELAQNDSPKGVMVNSPAIVHGTFGKGRVITSSPHPEQTAGMETFVEHAVRWVAGRDRR